MRILHVVPSYLPAVRYGGPINSVHGLCKALVDRGNIVEVLTTNADGRDVSPVPIATPVEIDGVTVTYFPVGFGSRLYRSPMMLPALIEKIKQADILHTHSVFLWPTSAAASIARRFGVPYVLCPRGMLVPELIQSRNSILKSAWISLFEKKNVARASSIHVTSELEAADLRRLGLPYKRLDLVPNGIDLPIDSPEPSVVSAELKSKRKLVLTLGRVSWKKGLDRLIRAMACVPNADLVIAGNDDENLMPVLLKISQEEGLQDRVHFVGPLFGSEKWRMFRQADVFALPSYSENFGIAVLEAMACAVPVVVTPEVGLAETIDRSGSGLVVSGNPNDFGAAIRNLLEDCHLRRQMGAAGKAIAARNFSWSGIGSRMEQIYSELSANTSPSLAKGKRVETEL